jgi:hypothetical protein
LCPEIGAPANGELREGRLLGRPRPIPNAVRGVSATGAGIGENNGFASDPEGVESARGIADDSSDVLSLETWGDGDGEDGVAGATGSSSFGVVEVDLEDVGVVGSEVLSAGSGLGDGGLGDGEGSSSPSNRLSLCESSEFSEKVSDRNDCVSSSSPSPSGSLSPVLFDVDDEAREEREEDSDEDLSATLELD